MEHPFLLFFATVRRSSHFININNIPQGTRKSKRTIFTPAVRSQLGALFRVPKKDELQAHKSSRTGYYTSTLENYSSTAL